MGNVEPYRKFQSLRSETLFHIRVDMTFVTCV